MTTINASFDNDRRVVVVEDETQRRLLASLAHLVPNSDVDVTQIKLRLANEKVRIPFHALLIILQPCAYDGEMRFSAMFEYAMCYQKNNK